LKKIRTEKNQINLLGVTLEQKTHTGLQNPKKMHKMVNWYYPGQLIRTAIDVTISTIFGRHADHRMIEALGCPDIKIYDYSQRKDKEFWIDYLGDTGDGWNSTYAIASTIGKPILNVTDPQGNFHSTERGNILVLGGDEVYPVASREGYEERLVAPFKAAMSTTEQPHPSVFAIPGNHDWYDSLVSFNRLFNSKNWFAGWKAPQERSYFALKLPHNWWLLGTDMQLGSDIDAAQVDYFKKVAENFLPEDKVILCLAEPHWIYETLYKEYDSSYDESNLCFLEQKLGKKISVFLAGDLHHYRRHANAEGVQKITSGGGGAFLHPTHGPAVDQLENNFHLKASFPDPSISRKLCWRNLLFLFNNFSFGLLTAFLYLLTCWTVLAPIANLNFTHFKDVVHNTIQAVLLSPLGFFWILICLGGFIFFTDTRSPLYRFFGGLLHAFTHLAAIFFLGWGVTYLCVTHLGFAFTSIPQLITSAFLIFCGGWLIGPIIMGIYLLISLNVFGRHSNEAFSALHCPDWKNFLRLKIDIAGKLTIFPIGIRRVPRKWKKTIDPQSPCFLHSDDPRASEPELIESPLHIQP
ncbi:MAG: metallophosphoesterase, partial [Chlamydiota bacterium]